jgi:hypothetical protein
MNEDIVVQDIAEIELGKGYAIWTWTNPDCDHVPEQNNNRSHAADIFSVSSKEISSRQCILFDFRRSF